MRSLIMEKHNIVITKPGFTGFYFSCPDNAIDAWNMVGEERNDRAHIRHRYRS